MWLKYLKLDYKNKLIVYKKFNFLYLYSSHFKNMLVLDIPLKFIVFNGTLYIKINKFNVSLIKFKFFHCKFIKIVYDFIFFVGKQIMITGIGLRSKEIRSFINLRLGYSHHCCIFFSYPINIHFEKNKFFLLSHSFEELKLFIKKTEHLKFSNPYKSLGILVNGKQYRKKLMKKD